MQFKAGYIVDSIAKVITDFKNSKNQKSIAKQTELDQINGLLQHVSSFDVEFPYPHNLDFSTLNPVLATLNNIITRGLPTRAPIHLENLFVGINLIEPNKDVDAYKFINSIEKIEQLTIFELLHIIEPNLQIKKENYGGKLGSNLEWKFLESNPFFYQILESQRDFSTINEKFIERNVDFSFTSPYIFRDELKKCFVRHGKIFEIDGPHHQLNEYKYYDLKRDDLASAENFDTFRFSDYVINNKEIDYNNLIGEEIYTIFQKNYNRNIKDDLVKYSLIFIPLAVARIQKTLIEYFLANPAILTEKKIIHIAIIERDLPCGAIALEILKDMIQNINGILEDKAKLKIPEIEITIFQNTKWVFNPKLHSKASVKDEPYFIANKNNFDIILDHSILRRSSIYNESDYQSDKAIKIRSSHYYDTSFGNERRIYCSNLLDYKTLVTKNSDGTYEKIPELVHYINYFIQNIFRKVGFRDGQLPIISRALQQKPVIGLLPTGGGKSLTYQLPALLQPGLCLVVDPIKSLMEDQVRVLKENWIDSCQFINSNLKREEKAKTLIDFRYGETMFLFVSPERFVMEDFRNILKSIHISIFELAFSYCVIDEVHCVSEWGHDFRTTYLMLGKNTQKFTKNREQQSVSLIGLTATASFDVLTDIERELSIESNDINEAIISIDNTIRPELFFNMIENDTVIKTTPIKAQNLKDSIGLAKQNQINISINKVIDDLNSIDETVIEKGLKQHFDEFEIDSKQNDTEKLKKQINTISEIQTKKDVCTVIFCPHTKGTLGVTQEASPNPAGKEFFEKLDIINSKGFFMGGDEFTTDKVKEKAHKSFIDFVTGNINYMVCTKAFGMGIDKDNIRSIYHLNFPSSPESYIQEAGRAGRNKNKSICTIMLDRQVFYTVKIEFILNNKTIFPTRSIRKHARNISEEYDSYQNRISNKYYKSIDEINWKFESIQIPNFDNSNIVEFQQDKAVHDFFHKNNFKGIQTENNQLDRFLNYNNGINTTRLKLIQDSYNIEFEEDIQLSLTKNPTYLGYLFINNANGKAIGKVRTLVTPLVADVALGASAEPDLEKSSQILKFIVDEWEKSKSTLSIYDFLTAPVIVGLNDGKSFIEYFEDSKDKLFQFKVPHAYNPNNLEQKLERDLSLIKLTSFNLHESKSVNDFLVCIKAQSFNFEDFILRIEEWWEKNVIGETVYENNKAEYEKLYYSEINKNDTLRLVYRLYSVGLIDDYTIDYKLGIITLHAIKRNKHFYIDKTEEHLLKHLSKARVTEKIDDLKQKTQNEGVIETIKKCVSEILDFTYSDIVEKRKLAVDDLYKFITDSINKAKLNNNETNFDGFWYNYFFKQEMYYYFNAKYAREGFKIGSEAYSLLDDTEKGSLSKWDTFIKYAEVLNIQNSYISECKMMRGSCKRIWRSLTDEKDKKNEYVLKLLYSYSTFGLNNKYYFQEAEEYFISGFRVLYQACENYDVLQKRIADFEDVLFKSTINEDFKPYFRLAKHKIMLEANLTFAQKITT